MVEFIYGLYEPEEEKAYECFKKLAEYFPESFKDYKNTEYGTFYDVMATSKNNIPENIELKLRKEGTDNFDSCYIEPHKWNNLLTDWRENGKLSIYINFIGGPDNVYIWQLQNIKKAKMRCNFKIGEETVDRICLDWNDAWHFQFDDKENKYKIKNKGV